MALYTTKEKIRSEAGFNNNPDITNATIEGYQIQANGRINTIVGQRYTLPLKNDILENSPAVQLLDLIEMILAAGYILAKEYGEDAAGTDKDGIERIQRAENMLKELLTGKITLIDNTGGAFDTSQGQEATIKGYPRSSEGRNFSTNMKF